MKHIRWLIVVAVVALAFWAGAAVQAQDKTPGSIGRSLWTMKCDYEASVIVQELPDGTNVVTCFLYY